MTTTQSTHSVPFVLDGKGGMIPFVGDGADPRRIVTETPSVVLNDPLYPRNVAEALRACAAWGARELWWTGSRVRQQIQAGERLPREERMRGYNDVKLRNHDRPFDFFPDDVVPVCIELRPGAIPIHYFKHPESAVYVFGPEDGSVQNGYSRLCHHYVVLPTAHCINLASAVNCVLMHRRLQRIEAGLEPDLLMEERLADESRGWQHYSMDESQR